MGKKKALLLKSFHSAIAEEKSKMSLCFRSVRKYLVEDVEHLFSVFVEFRSAISEKLKMWTFNDGRTTRDQNSALEPSA